MGVYLGASTKIVDRATGEVFQGRVPAYSVVVSGTMPGKPLPNGQPGPSLYCDGPGRSEEHTSELQSLMRISYAVFCLKKKKESTDMRCEAVMTSTNTTQPWR